MGRRIARDKAQLRGTEAEGGFQFACFQLENRVGAANRQRATDRSEGANLANQWQALGFDCFPGDAHASLANAAEALFACLLTEEPEGAVGGVGEARIAKAVGVFDDAELLSVSDAV